MDPRELLNDQEEAQRLSLTAWEANMWTAMPAVVTSVNFDLMTVQCQITIQVRVFDSTGNMTLQNISPLVDVPIVFPSAGGFTITMPVATGDEILVVFSSRCIDSWWQQGWSQSKPCPPLDFRMHDLSDGFAIPGPKSVPNAIASISTTDCQIRNNAGTTYVSIGADGKIKLISPSEVDVTAPSIKLTGDVVVTGTIEASGEITAGTIPLTTHLHSGVTSGSSNTGTPVP